MHAGSTFRHAPTGSGWPSYHLEDSILQGAAFEDTLVSFLAEGVFQKFPGTKLVLMESGFTWLPTLLWRTNRGWRGMRTEIPGSIALRPRSCATTCALRCSRSTCPTPTSLNRVMDHVRSDELIVFSTDYPHWQFDGDDALPEGLSDAMIRKILIDNPLATYPRLRAAPDATANAARESGQGRAPLREEMAP